MKIKHKKRTREVSIDTGALDLGDVHTLLTSIWSAFRPTRKEKRAITRIVKERKRCASGNFGTYAYLHLV